MMTPNDVNRILSILEDTQKINTEHLNMISMLNSRVSALEQNMNSINLFVAKLDDFFNGVINDDTR